MHTRKHGVLSHVVTVGSEGAGLAIRAWTCPDCCLYQARESVSYLQPQVLERPRPSLLPCVLWANRLRCEEKEKERLKRNCASLWVCLVSFLPLTDRNWPLRSLGGDSRIQHPQLCIINSPFITGLWCHFSWRSFKPRNLDLAFLAKSVKGGGMWWGLRRCFFCEGGRGRIFVLP